MRRLVSSSLALLFLGLAPGAASAASLAPPARNPSITLVDGWWEREHRADDARQQYWRLPPPAAARYNQLQAEINRLETQRAAIDQRIARAVNEQHEILGFRGR
jgi:hypothetical protein